MAFLIGGANSAAADAAYDIDNSLRFNGLISEGDDPMLTYTPAGTSSDASKRKYTFSFWVKRGRIADEQGIIFYGKTGSDAFQLFFDSNDTLRFIDYGDDFGGSGYNLQKITNRLFRDPSAWYSIILIVDTTDGTAGDRVKLYINGVRETSFSSSDDPDQNYAGFVGSADACDIGCCEDAAGKYLEGYISEFHYIDGTAKAHTDFGEFDEDSGIWKPKEYTGGSYGTNGFFLEFKQSGTGTNSSGMGADTSGNDNHLAVTNLTATDQCTDTPTNNFCTLNPLWTGAAGTISEGNTKLVSGSSEYGPVLGTIAMTSGKWYWEVLCTTFNYWRTGIADVTLPLTTSWNLGYESSPDNAVYRDGGYVGKNGSNILSGQPSLAVDETVSVAFDADSGKIWFAQDGAWINSGDPAAGSNEATSVTAGESYFPALSDGSDSTSSTYSFNFGNPPHSISSSQADDDGYGNFEFDVPAGFYALCTKNLAEYG